MTQLAPKVIKLMIVTMFTDLLTLPARFPKNGLSNVP